MYQSILEYIVNADLFYRLWMVAEYQTPTAPGDRMKMAQPREEWLPELAGTFEDVRLIPGVIRCDNPNHLLDTQMRFHTGNKTPTIDAEKVELFWGVGRSDVFRVNTRDRGEDSAGHVIPHPMRSVGPCKIVLSGLKMWHHQDVIHRRRGDAIICEQAEFFWNTKKDTEGAFRENGPFRVNVKGFRAKANMGTLSDASYEHLGVSWGTENGIRIGEERVQAVINANDINLNYLLCASAFLDEGEEFIFWDEIGRSQEAA